MCKSMKGSGVVYILGGLTSIAVGVFVFYQRPYTNSHDKANCSIENRDITCKVSLVAGV